MVVQNISASSNTTDLTFTIKNDDLNKTIKLIKDNNKIYFKKLLIDKNVSKVINNWCWNDNYSWCII